jgi:hypothetical protein
VQGRKAASGAVNDGGENITLGSTAFSGNSTVNGLLDNLRIYNRGSPPAKSKCSTPPAADAPCSDAVGDANA